MATAVSDGPAQWKIDPVTQQPVLITAATGGTTPQTTGDGTSPTPVLPTPVIKPVVKPVATATGTVAGGASIVPGTATGPNQINVVDAAGSIATDPSSIMSNDMLLSTQIPKISAADIKAGTINAAGYAMDPDALNIATQTATADLASGVAAKPIAQVTTATSADRVAQQDMTGAQGTVSQQAQVDASGNLIDTAAVAAGQTATGQALQQAAQQKFTSIIDTSTLAGKILAEQLGEGNYTDAKATLKGQLDILQAEFVDPATGEPRIPAWAAGTARNVGRIAAFTGMTGTAATAAMAQALMEASLPIAQQDSAFFQTLTVKNLDNRQEQTINRANVLAKMDLANMDARMTAAVTNANNFMKMDLANLDNDQQAAVINHEARVQSILEDTKAENTKRLFMADAQNESNMFYSELNATIDQFNSAQTNSMRQFNASETNDTRQFNAQLENAREQFYKNMQFQIDTANAKWRQTITLTENQQRFEAAAIDVKNKVDISQEALNRIWDRSDALLDYSWKGAENEKDRKNQVNLAIIDATNKEKVAETEGTGSVIGALVGAAGSLLLGAFGA